MELSTTLILIGGFILMEAFFSGSEIGMIKVNTADSARLNIVEMGGKGGLVDEVL